MLLHYLLIYDPLFGNIYWYCTQYLLCDVLFVVILVGIVIVLFYWYLFIYLMLI